jgi:hypothetical protein
MAYIALMTLQPNTHKTAPQRSWLPSRKSRKPGESTTPDPCTCNTAYRHFAATYDATREYPPPRDPYAAAARRPQCRRRLHASLLPLPPPCECTSTRSLCRCRTETTVSPTSPREPTAPAASMRVPPPSRRHNVIALFPPSGDGTSHHPTPRLRPITARCCWEDQLINGTTRL